MTTNTITNIEAADTIIRLFDFLKLGKKGWSLFETLYGKPFDIMAFTPNDYVFMENDTYYGNNLWGIDLGEGWHFSVQPLHSWSSATANAYRIRFSYDGGWCAGMELKIDKNTGTIFSPIMTALEAEKVWDRIFTTIKRRASVTIRENKKYLSRPAFYDTLEKELNIKVRKKK